MTVEIRAERQRDRPAVFELNRAAFPTDAEARLVDTLRSSDCGYLSLVAVDGRKILGHILFTPVTLSDRPDRSLMGLAPMAVLPECQRNGIGSRLVHAGLERCSQAGTGAVAVLGHAEYYPRFGVAPSSRWRIDCEFDVPEEAFMIKELEPGYLHDSRGTIHYHPAFSGG